VSTAQWKIGIVVMVKSQFFPAAWVMAFVAFFTITTAVYVIYFVAGNTVLGGFRVPVAMVTTGTTRRFMFTVERKSAFFMLVTGFQPVISGMTGMTFFCQFTELASTMRALLLVT
jgi:hypothetical protein